MENSLFVFAIEQESADKFDDCSLLFTGIGKVQACLALTRRLTEKKPSVVINLGTAGAKDFSPGEIVNAVSFVQRDMDATGLGFDMFQTPFSDLDPKLDVGISVPHLPQVVCGSGDNFSVSDDFGKGFYDIVDMEAYALAHVCDQLNVPFLCLKYISDGADGEAHIDWNEALQKTAVALRREIDGIDLKQYLI